MKIEIEITEADLISLLIPPKHAEGMLKSIKPKWIKALVLEEIGKDWTPFFEKYGEAFK